MAIKPRSAIARFWSHVRPEQGDRCWEWASGAPGQRYPMFRPDGGKSANSVGAHRFSYELHFGPIADGLYVCHRCDNKRCVNPAHLFLGSQADNVKDCVTKGRSSRGSRGGRAKITEAQALEIRRRARAGERRAALSAEFGLSKTGIQKIAAGENWGHLDDGDVGLSFR